MGNLESRAQASGLSVFLAYCTWALRLPPHYWLLIVVALIFVSASQMIVVLQLNELVLSLSDVTSPVQMPPFLLLSASFALFAITVLLFTRITLRGWQLKRLQVTQELHDSVWVYCRRNSETERRPTRSQTNAVIAIRSSGIRSATGVRLWLQLVRLTVQGISLLAALLFLAPIATGVLLTISVACIFPAIRLMARKVTISTTALRPLARESASTYRPVIQSLLHGQLDDSSVQKHEHSNWIYETNFFSRITHSANVGAIAGVVVALGLALSVWAQVSLDPSASAALATWLVAAVALSGLVVATSSQIVTLSRFLPAFMTYNSGRMELERGKIVAEQAAESEALHEDEDYV